MILVSTGALLVRANNRDYNLLRNCAENLNCHGFEFMMYSTWHEETDKIATLINSLTIPCPSFHCEKNIGELISRNQEGDFEEALRLFDLNCSLASEIGSKILILHLWNGQYSDRNIKHNLSCYQAFREIADRYKLNLTVENVVCNKADSMTHLRELAEAYPDILFTFDTKMAEFHKQLAELYKTENQWFFPHIAHIHVNDYKGGYMDWQNLKTLHIGKGKIDFDSFFTYIKKNGYTGHFTIEATSVDADGNIDFAALNESIDRLRDYSKDKSVLPSTLAT